jgi:hypothetical protein
MRKDIQRDSVYILFEELAKRAKGSGRIYITGGVTAVLLGWRETTADVDLKLLPEPEGIFEAIRDVKDILKLNVELASPDDFIPPLPGWEARSKFIVRFGSIDFYHYDFYAQALSKIARGHVRDLADVESMFNNGFVTKDEVYRLFCAIEPNLIRYPAVNPAAFRRKVEAILGQIS